MNNRLFTNLTLVIGGFLYLSNCTSDVKIETDRADVSEVAAKDFKIESTESSDDGQLLVSWKEIPGVDKYVLHLFSDDKCSNELASIEATSKKAVTDILAAGTYYVRLTATYNKGGQSKTLTANDAHCKKIVHTGNTAANAGGDGSTNSSQSDSGSDSDSSDNTGPVVSTVTSPTNATISTSGVTSSNVDVTCSKTGDARILDDADNDVIVDWTAVTANVQQTLTVTGAALDAATTSDGPVTLKVECRDAALNVSTADTSRSITLDTTAASVSSVSAPTQATVSTSGTITSSNVDITCNETGETRILDNADDDVIVDWTAVTASVAETIAVSGASLDAATTSDGTVTLKVLCRDSAQNTGSANTSRTITLDTAAPTVSSVTAPTQSAVSTTGGITSASVDVTCDTTGTAQILDNADDDTIVSATAVTGAVAETITITGAALDSATTADSSVTLKVQCLDAVGNTSTANTSRSITLDTTAPSTSSVTAPTQGTVSTAGSVVSANIDVTCNETGHTRILDNADDDVIVTWTAVTGSVAETIAVSGSALDSATTSDGTVTLKVVCRDAVQNVGTADTSRTIILDTTAPTVSAVAAPSVAAVSTSATITSSNVDVTCSETGEARILDNADDDVIVTWTAVTASVAETITVTGSALDSATASDGSVTLKVVCRDGMQHNSSANTSRSITLDTTAPSVNVGSDASANASYAIDATTSDASTAVATYAWTKQSGAGNVNFTAQTSEDTNVTNDTQETATLRLTVTDTVGNSAFDELQFTWDTQAPPVLTAFSGATGSGFGEIDLTVDFPADTSDYDSLQVYRTTTGSASTGVAAPSCGSATLVKNYSSFVDETLTDNTGGDGLYYSYRACIYDAAGNVTNSQTATDVQSKGLPTPTVFFDARDIDGDATANSGDIGGNTQDPWGNLGSGGNTGDLVNFDFNASSGWDGDGTVGDPYVLRFDGSNDYVDLGSFTMISMGVWFRVNALTADSRYIFQGAGSSYAVVADGALHVRYNGSGIVRTTGLALDTWYHLAFIHDGTDIVFYLNGVEFTRDTRSAASSQSYTLSYSASGFFNGEIGEFRAYSSSLTEAELAILYLSGRSRFYTAPANVQIERIIAGYSPTSGTNTFTVWGWNFDDIDQNSEVTVGGAAGSSLNVITTDGKLTIDAPSGSLGVQDLVLNDGSNSDTAAGAYHYTATPTDNLLYYLDAANIDSAGSKGASATDADWHSLVDGRVAGLFNFDFDANSGWQGDGTVGDPYRLKFDGSNDHIHLGSFQIKSMSMWFKPDVVATSSSRYLLAQPAGSRTYAIIAYGELRLRHSYSDVIVTGLATDTWYNLAFVHDGTDVIFYLNGEEIGRDARSADILQEFTIGSASGSVNYDGDIGELRVYSDTLTEAEIAALYFEGRAKYFTAPANVQIERIVKGYSATSGTNTFTVWGWNFDNIDLDSEVTVGGSAGSSLNVIDTNGKLTIAAPSGSLGGQNLVLNDGSNSDTASAAYRYTDTAIASNLVAYFDAANIDSIGAKGSSVTDAHWKSLADGRYAGLHNFDFDANSGWQGDGTTGDPYRLKFDGTDDYLTLGSYAVTGLSVWFRADDLSSTRYLFYADSATYVYLNSDAIYVRYNSSSTFSKSLAANTWYHLALVHDGTKETFYLNGSAFASDTRSADQLRDYSVSTYNGSYFDGDIAELRVYSGGTFTQADVETLFQEGRSRFPNTNHTVFVTSTASDGNFGDLAGADEICNSLAESALLDGAWKAIISDSSTDAIDRIYITGTIYDNAGTPNLVANNSADLWDNTINAAIDYDEYGSQVSGGGSTEYWTGTDADGTANTNTCNDWADGTNSYNGQNGDSTNTNSGWISLGATNTCDQTLKLLCISQ